ncbi:hypothetical protein MKK69_04565 [Methylobacterium sp. J-026]|uniref:hypothetical protein n=1 Tax=Methylobacterium sp. J-026 TaxID=2836624 RepID=UPI001FB95BDD|nr:hypothetical protein [Methylobacterium sp. J-026]MCJ2133341.1 hypothetical protein [Methylobacterium sp. J-026]
MDRVTELAAHLLANARHVTTEELPYEIAGRWPGISTDEIRQAFMLARETKRAEGQVYAAEANALDAIADTQQRLGMR